MTDCITKKFVFSLLFLFPACLSINQMCYSSEKNQTCPTNSFCNQNQYCQCQQGWALWCDLPSTTLTEQDQTFQVTDKPKYFTIVPSDTDSLFIYRFFLCGKNENKQFQITLRLFADQGTQRQLNHQNLIGNITLEIQNECLPLSSPYMDFNLQPNGQIEQMILSINIEGPKIFEGPAIIGLSVDQIFFIKISTLWIIVIVFISIIALCLISGLCFCIYQLRNSKRGRFIDNNINYFEQLIPKTKITSINYLPDNTCPVCLFDFEIGNEVRKTLCNHLFHYDCLDNWCKKNLSCPSCRSNMSKSYLKEMIRMNSEQSAINKSEIQELGQQFDHNQENIKQKLILPNN